ncbi:alpha-xenorhabdolysin family binary toxin subunit A [Pseudomonas sp. 7P_10.2_Bac1]|uniref:alpha-xenorhabdolysin family binary toxin subunit A n=1 Tax=Pseudomonas sp. 7P_10.2_Bac1 TaxID=2971614 RepID=UPI0021C909B8|nr:alpha-xenorhabdolysin family binary toxin subunit A [Pseudomonas sp. 7P_10.2_Bac1]MCU1727587.1 alpha-xenorhabdolysin family binary toxin subunit A [Pseudomonas sp. 7P_10.2_Bac1]
MKSDLSTENIIKKMSYDEIILQAQNAPRVFTSISTAEQDSVNREPGLLLTKEEIINIKLYEAAALALPHTMEDIQIYLNYGDPSDGGLGLEYKNFLATFGLTRKHALSWSALHDDMKLTGTKLKIFAHSMTVYGDSIEELYKGIKALKKLENYLEINKIETLAQLKEIEVSSGVKFPDIELEKGTTKQLGNYLDKIFEKVSKNLEDTKNIQNKLTTFSDDLHNHVLPNIKTRLKLVNSNPVQSDIEALTNSIEERALHIEEKNKEYKALVEKSVSAVGTFNMAGLALAIYLGVEADGIRVECNQLRDEQALHIEKLRKKNQTLASLQRVRLDLQNLELVTFNADIATKNLRHVWNVIYVYIQQSKESIDDINDALSLGLFMTEFKLVIDPWRDIEKQTDIFINVFKEADEEYKRIYIDSDKKSQGHMEF